MRRNLRSVAIVLGLLVAGSTVAESQGLVRQKARDGFWFGLGLGGGIEDFDVDVGFDRGRGLGAYIRLGGTVNDHVLVGGEVLVWENDNQNGEISRVNVTATGLFYPSATGGWFVKAGGGVASYTNFGFEMTGVGTTLGTGIDLRISDKFSITPNVDIQSQFFENNTVHSLLFTLGFTLH